MKFNMLHIALLLAVSAMFHVHGVHGRYESGLHGNEGLEAAQENKRILQSKGKSSKSGPTPSPPTTGACCFKDGTGRCTDSREEGCSRGIWQGLGTTCASTTCPRRGACCFNDGSGRCVDSRPQECNRGIFQGFGTSCGDEGICHADPTPPPPSPSPPTSKSSKSSKGSPS